MALNIQKDIRKCANSKRAQQSLRFFKTSKGDYGAGDVFIGLSTPQARKIAKKYQDISLVDVEVLLASKIHEERMIALFILVKRFSAGDEKEQCRIFKFYLKHRKFVNNWDLVDSSAPTIVGGFLVDRDRSVLMRLVQSKSLWDRRIAILATLAFIREGESKDTIRLARILLTDDHDLIHKAVGWMLREVGKQVDERELKAFLDRYAYRMPRTMLRYSLERLSVKDRQKYMAAKKNSYFWAQE